MPKRLASKPRELSKLEKLSLAAQRRMGLEVQVDAKQAFAELLKNLKTSLERKMEKRIEQVMDEVRKAQQPAVTLFSSSVGLRSTPPTGSKKVKNIWVTPVGLFHVEYEDDPV